MKVLWTQAPLAAAQISDSLARSEIWHPSTTKTLLRRLCRKKAVAIRRGSKPFLYVPQLTEEAWLKEQSESFLQRFFGGSIKPLLVHFVKGQKISAKDLDDLRRILDQGENE